MTLATEETITCPTCNNQQSVFCYQSINATIDPELVEQLINGSINVFRCDACSYGAEINTPLLYNDPRIETMVLYYPKNWLLEDPEGAVQSYLSMAESVATSEIVALMSNLSRPENPAVVFSREELIAQIMFRQHLYQLEDSHAGTLKPSGKNNVADQPSPIAKKVAAARAAIKDPKLWITSSKLIFVAAFLLRIRLPNEPVFYISAVSLFAMMGGHGLWFRSVGQSQVYGWVKGLFIWLCFFLLASAVLIVMDAYFGIGLSG